MSLLSLQTYQDEEAVRVALGGELDISSALLFDEELKRIEDRAGPRLRLRALRELKFMAPTGLGLILNAHFRAVRAGPNLRTLLGSDSIKRILKLPGVLE